eukprot:533518-Hanusia_phi.AAC.1
MPGLSEGRTVSATTIGGLDRTAACPCHFKAHDNLKAQCRITIHAVGGCTDRTGALEGCTVRHGTAACQRHAKI